MSNIPALLPDPMVGFVPVELLKYKSKSFSSEIIRLFLVPAAAGLIQFNSIEQLIDPASRKVSDKKDYF